MRERAPAAHETQSKRGFYNSRIPAKRFLESCEFDDTRERTLEMAWGGWRSAPRRMTGF